MRAYLVEDFYEVLRVCWAKGRRAIGGLFGSQGRGHDEGDKLGFNSKLHEVFGRDRRKIW